MIELKNDNLVFSFPEVHKDATLSVDFQRTLRIPDDGKTHYLPPGLGSFPLRHVDDFAAKVPSDWLQRGGVMLPMYQSEALWIHFGRGGGFLRGPTGYPFAVKIATGKINAVTGDAWRPELTKKPQDYMVSPTQPWLDGYCVEKGTIRQFVAMPLGAGYTAEEQLTGEAEHGGLQLLVYPMKAEAYERMMAKRTWEMRRSRMERSVLSCASSLDMGLAPGGKMRQEIYDDPYKFGDWDVEHASRCFVHIANSMVWQSITGSQPPSPPPTAEQYTSAGLPWFDYYAEGETAVEGSDRLAGMQSVKELGEAKGDVPLPENESVTPENVVKLRAKLGKNQVREGAF